MALFEEIEESAELSPPDDALPSIPEDMSVQQMDELIKGLMDKRAQAEEWKKTTTELNKEIARLEGQVVMALHQFERDNYKSKFGAVSIVKKWRVSVPVTDDDKKKLFEHFKQREILWKMATVNSNSLNSLFLADWEAAKQRGGIEGLEFRMPGVGEPKLHESLSVRKA